MRITAFLRTSLGLNALVWGGCSFDSTALAERTPCEFQADCPGGECVAGRCWYGGASAGEDVTTGDTGPLDSDATDSGAGIPDGVSDVAPDVDFVSCAPGLSRCEGTVLSRCNADGTELQQTDCASTPCADESSMGCTCAAGACVAILCEPSETRCTEDGAAYVTCRGDGVAFADRRNCPERTRCIQDGGGAVCSADLCVPGSTRCNPGQPDSVQICLPDGAQYAPGQPCLAAEFCLDGVCEPDICRPGDRLCVDDGTVSVCRSNGSGFESQVCPEATACSTVTNTCQPTVCEPNSFRCTSASGRQQCSDDGTEWLFAASCSGSEVCTAGACVPRVCLPGSVSCVSSSQRGTCNADGTAITTTDCAGGQTCRDGVCANRVCEPSTTSCDGNNLVRCNTAGSASSIVQSCPFGCGDGACLAARCGDGILNTATGEQCDDGNPSNCDGCRTDCTLDRVIQVTTASSTTNQLNWTPADAALTVQGWFSVSSRDGALAGVYSPANGHGAWLRISDGRPEFVLSMGAGATGVAASSVSIRGTGWHHLAGVRVTPQSIALFVDGRLAAVARVETDAASISAARLFLGAISGLTSAAFQADELSVERRAAFGAPFAPPRSLGTPTSDTIAAWRVDENSGNVLNDASSGNRDLALSGVSWQPASCFNSPDTSLECGDGEIAAWEFCDDGDRLDGAACSADCGPFSNCGDGRPGLDGTCYRVETVARNVSAQRTNCTAWGGTLMSIGGVSEQVQAEILMRASTVLTAWIGLTDSASEGTFLWPDGTPFTYARWNTDSGEPNNNGEAPGEDCVQIVAEWGYRWNDAACSRSFPAICERPAAAPGP